MSDRRVDRPGRSAEHPTMKPPQLIRRWENLSGETVQRPKRRRTA